MNLIIVVVGLNLLYQLSPVKTVTVILRWPEINTYFHSTINSAYYSPVPTPNEIRNTLFRSDEELCDAAEKSTFFDIDKEEHSTAQSSSSSDFNEKLLSLMFPELNFEGPAENDFIRKDRKVKYDNTEIQLSTFPCAIFSTKTVYLSQFYKGEIIVYFIFAKMQGSDIPQLFAAIGKDEAFRLHNKKPKTYYTRAWNLIDVKERERIYRKMLSMTPTQCAWLSSILERLKLNKHLNLRKYINLSILVKDDSVVTKYTFKINGVYYCNVPILQYRVKNLNIVKSENYKVITPGLEDPNEKTSEFFYGDKFKNSFAIHKLFVITSLYVT